jgi:hypothetical protein
MNNAVDALQILNKVSLNRPFLRPWPRAVWQAKKAVKTPLVIYAKTQHRVIIDFKDLAYFELKKHVSIFSLKMGLVW